ncbi:MAG: dihydroorotate dehydrogenase-like protein [Acidimicrobiales bacterium]|jgi:dihydroorotate dehydrogenase (fumarate)|nr:dihydroorotate dehydrogenase-like protein [Acidimicrobiales bacterium]
MMADLSTRYLGLTLRSPLVASSSPYTGRLDTLRRLEAAGVGAVVLPSLFEEQLEAEELGIDAMLGQVADVFAEAQSFFPELQDYNTGPDRYLTLLEQAKSELSVPVIASLNGSSVGGWVRYAAMLERAGADALELNVYRLAADATKSGAEVELEVLDLVRAVRDAVSVPVSVKLSPYWSSLAAFAEQLVQAGADGLVLFNRFYQPDLDLESLEGVPRLVLSTPDELRLTLRWVGILHGQVRASLAATSGVHRAEDALKVLLAGADVAMMASAILHEGPEHVATVEAGVRAWIAEHGYTGVEQLKGSASYHSGPNPTAYERANYAQTLSSWGS